MTCLAIVLLGLSLSPAPGALEGPTVVPLWPGGKAIEDDAAKIGPEHFRDLLVKGEPYKVAGKPTKWKTNVTEPTISVYRPRPESNTKLAMIICPGGGYHNLGWDVEGEEVAEWLNGLGVTGVILKYRCPRRPGEEMTTPPLGPLKDGQRAVSLVRTHADEWGIDPHKIGIIGFSAGGHLAGATAANFRERAYKPIDELDKVSCRPDFAVMVYSGYFQHKGALSPTIKLERETPPMFFVHATDDTVSDVDNTLRMYSEMRKLGVSAELHVYAEGGHGFAVRRVGLPCEEWKSSMISWLKHKGFLPQK